MVRVVSCLSVATPVAAQRGTTPLPAAAQNGGPDVVVNALIDRRKGDWKRAESDHVIITEAAFQSARVECDAQDAYIMRLQDRRAIGFKGFAPSHKEQATCLSQKLKGTDASIAFISEPPGP